MPDQIIGQLSGPAVLPAPSQLPAAARRSGSELTEADLIRHGGDFNADLPYANATPDPGQPVLLEPAWAPSPGGLTGLAYCIYDFSVEGYDRESEINYGWSAPKPGPSNCYLAAANWETDRWEWFTGNIANHQPLADMSRYISVEGRMLVVIAVAGQAPASLDYVRLGTPTVVAKLTVTPASGYVPLSATLKAGASSAGAGSIVNYEWDYDGDGEYDGQTASSSTEHQYDETGTFEPGVRVTSSYGEQDLATASVTANGGWTHSWGTAQRDYAEDVAVDAGSGSVYVLGQFTDSSDDQNVCLLKYNLAGSLLWARAWGGSEFDYARAIDVAGDGAIYITGVTYSYSAGNGDILVQRWDSEGNVSWTRTWGTADVEAGRDIVAYGGAVYVACDSTGFGNGYDMLLLKYSTSGDLQWARSLGGDRADSFSAMTVRRPNPLADEVVYLCGDTLSFDDNDRMLAYVSFLQDGSLTAFRTTTIPGSSIWANSIATSDENVGYEIYLSGKVDGIAPNASSPLVVQPGGTVTARVWFDNDYGRAHGLTVVDDTVYLAGTIHEYDPDEETDVQSFVAAFSRELLPISQQTFSRTGQDVALRNLGELPGGGLLCCGYCLAAQSTGWTISAGNFEEVAVGWTDREMTPTVRAGTTSAPGAGSFDPGPAVIDTGGGDDDLLAAALPLF